MPMVATTFAATVLLWVGSCPTQLFYHADQKSMTAKYLPAINGDLGKEGVMPKSTKMIQKGLHLGEAMEMTEYRVLD